MSTPYLLVAMPYLLLATPYPLCHALPIGGHTLPTALLLVSSPDPTYRKQRNKHSHFE